MNKFLLGMIVGGLGSYFGVKRTLRNLIPSVPEVSEDTVLLFQFDYSPYCLKIRHILDYKKLPYECINLPPIGYQSFNRQHSGQVKVPYIKHRGKVIADSTPIAFYLEKIQSEPALFPADPQEREQMLFLEDWLDEAMVPAFGNMIYLMNYKDPSVVINDPNIKTGVEIIDRNKRFVAPLLFKRTMKKRGLALADEPHLRQRLHEVLKRAKFLLGDNRYLVGKHLSLADITLASYLDLAKKFPELEDSDFFRPLAEWRESIVSEIQG